MTRLHLLPLLALPALAACGSGGAPADVAATNVTPPAGETDYVQRVRTMPAGQRTAVLLRAIRDARQDCQTVTAVSELAAAGGTASWSATCDDGRRWVVAIAGDGTANVTGPVAADGVVPR